MFSESASQFVLYNHVIEALKTLLTEAHSAKRSVGASLRRMDRYSPGDSIPGWGCR